ncbi:MAG: hypothetical protein MJE68_19795 [Proteobacteria bacterium]|nr:hypothetical protein [Pseudomonadota bacterium]
MLEILNDTLVPFIVAIAFLYTMLRAVTAVRREDIAKDIAKLETGIEEVKTTQIETTNRLEASRREDNERLEASRREDTQRLEASRREDNERLEASRHEDTQRLEKNQARLEKNIADINAKFDRYLFGKLEKTDDTDDADKGK